LEVVRINKELEKLYQKGTSKKLKLPENIIDKYFATIQKIEAAINIYDLSADIGLHFERLQGYENLWSMRLSGKYRLLMEIDWQNDKQTIGIFYLTDITNHYGD
jgi:plasmid maintenance system killer protein